MSSVKIARCHSVELEFSLSAPLECWETKWIAVKFNAEVLTARRILLKFLEENGSEQQQVPAQAWRLAP